MDEIGASIGVVGDDLSPWYQVRTAELRRKQASGVLRLYKDSIYEMLRSVYPQYQWVPWKFHQMPRQIFKDDGILQDALRHVEVELRVTEPEDWYRISLPQLEKLGVGYLFVQSGGLYAVLQKLRPEGNWKETHFLGVHTPSKKLLGIMIREIWPNEIVEEDFKFPESKYTASFFLPSLGLAFDLQTTRDYNADALSGNTRFHLKEDEVKINYLKAHSIEMLTLPFWWDRSKESLIGTLLHKLPLLRPSLVQTLKPEIFDNLTTIPEETVVMLSNWRKRNSGPQ